MKKDIVIQFNNKNNINELYDISRLIVEKPEASIKFNFSRKYVNNIIAASEFVQKKAILKQPIYGINTGFGFLASKQINYTKLKELQINLIRSHCVGVGQSLQSQTIVLMWLLRIVCFCQGKSGVRFELINKITELLQNRIIPCVPSRGSVGASGDLAPSAHAALVLLGEGDCNIYENGKYTRSKTSSVFKRFDIKPIELLPKEGLSLINGTQLTTALSIEALHQATEIFNMALIAAAFSFFSLDASTSFLHEYVLETNCHLGTKKVGGMLNHWLEGWSNKGSSTQDPYSIRCIPQVYGSSYEIIQFVKEILNKELYNVDDNPLVFSERGEIISNGNFHAIYPTKAIEFLAISLISVGNMSERRTNHYMNYPAANLPIFLTKNPGLNSGFMMIQVTAAALLNECKSLAFPASVDNIPTNCNQEDHVSMGPTAGYKTLHILENISKIVSIELLCSLQAADYRNPSRMPSKLKKIYNAIRLHIPFLEKDTPLSEYIEKIYALRNIQEFKF